MTQRGKTNSTNFKKSIELTCAACGKLKKDKEYYVSYNKIHSTGRIPYCKDCLKNMISDDNGNVELDRLKKTLQLIDKPYIYDIWKSSLEENGDSFGLLMKNLAMTQYRNLGWKDSIFEAQLNKELNYSNASTSNIEEKIYSRQWMGEYSDLDVEYLDNYLKGLHGDFKIITENHKDYAKKIAKASLHMDKCFQEMLQGVTGADKRYKDARETFDTMSKSAQFSENTRGQNDISLGCFGVLFDRVEQKKWIPQHIPLEKDDYDKLIDYFSTINKSM